MEGPAETLAYVAGLSAPGRGANALGVVDVQPGSSTYGTVVGWWEAPGRDDEFHHYGWNACSSALCPSAPHPHVERRYLLVPGIRSSRVYVLDVKENPRQPRLVKVIEAEELRRRAGYSRPHTLHCGPQGIYLSCLGGAEPGDPGGVALLDHTTFEVLGAFEVDRGPQRLAYDLWWHLADDTMITSEWGTPADIEDGLQGERLLAREYGHALHFWDLRRRRHLQRLDLGSQYQMVLELRPAHDPRRRYGFTGVVVNVEDLSGSIWTWHRDGDQWAVTKVIDIPAEAADPSQLPPLLQPFGAVPPLITDIDLSMDDRFLYVSCWGTGQLRQYDVRDPFHPALAGTLEIGGIVRRSPHPAAPATPLAGGPQMVEISRDGRRVYFTNSLYAAWDDQFYPDGVGSWMVKADVGPGGGMAFDPAFFPQDFRGLRGHQVRLEGGDCSSDSYCFS